jgi:hypothetical protein
VPALTRDELATTHALIEKKIGRALSIHEQAIDVLKLDQALNAAKTELEAAIRTEMKRAGELWLRTGSNPIMSLTPAMEKPLDHLHTLGIEEGRAELERAGYDLARENAAPDPTPGEGLAGVKRTVSSGLNGLRVRIEHDLVHADLASASSSAIADAILRIPGARDIASRVISTALISGLGETFEQNQDLVDGWVYTAVLDDGTCDECAPLDGTEYDTLDDLFQDLPDFGPNPDCYGGGRCRCRAVPSSPIGGGL